MSTFRLLISILINQLHSIQYEIHLNATHTSHAGIQYIFKNDQNVNTAHNIWHIDPPSQDHYDLLLALEREWMFNPSMQSQVTLTLHGHTPNISESDGEFLIVFAVDTQYFSVVIRLDTQRNRWKYFPGILSDSNPSLQTLANTQNVLADIIQGGPDSLNRWKRVSNNDTWTDIEPPHKDALQWPFSIKLTNNPIRNTLLYECILHNKILETEYQTAFMTDKPIYIYIMNDADDGKPFDIYSIHVQYADNQTVNITNTQIGTSTSTSMQTQQTELPIFNVSLPPTMKPSKSPIMEETIIAFAASASDQNIVGLMIGVVFGCVAVAILIVLGFFFYLKKEENDNDPSSLNRSEYHTPAVILSENSISQILEKKRRESQQFAENNKKRKASDTGQRTQSIVPIIDSDGNDDVVIDSDEYAEDEKFDED